MLNKKQIEEKLESIFESALSPISIFNNSDKLDMNLLGEELGFRSRHLLFIYCAIEKDFQMKIPAQIILEGKFNTFNNILKCIYKEKGINE